MQPFLMCNGRELVLIRLEHARRGVYLHSEETRTGGVDVPATWAGPAVLLWLGGIHKGWPVFSRLKELGSGFDRSKCVTYTVHSACNL